LPRAQIGAIHADGELFADMRQKLARARDGAAWRWIWKAISPVRSRPRWLPFVALRCISDSAEMDLPPAIAVSMKPDGGAYGAVLGSILRQPGQLGHLMRSVKTFSRAYGLFGATLRQVHGRLGFDHR
jgi:hypothetical protein